MRFGSLLHTMTLEPGKIPDRYVLAPKCDRRTKDGKAAYAAFVEASKGKTVIDGGDVSLARDCADKLLRHDQIGELLLYSEVHQARIEQALTFSIEGTPCKAKPDWLSVPLKLIVDVKTTRDASPEGFAKSVATFGYHRQAAMYLHGAQEVFGIEARFIFACVTTSPPYQVACYELDLSSLRKGAEELQMLVGDYERRKAANNWRSSWSSGVVPLSLPRWYRGQVLTMDEETDDNSNS
jgi:exodeoxyribonuclease VIII